LGVATEGSFALAPGGAQTERKNTMKAIVDEDACTGCGLCEETCPEVFEMEDGLAKVKVDPVPADQEETCREAADGCPVEAIAVEE
jgi:ferredoxin